MGGTRKSPMRHHAWWYDGVSATAASRVQSIAFGDSGLLSKIEEARRVITSEVTLQAVTPLLHTQSRNTSLHVRWREDGDLGK